MKSKILPYLKNQMNALLFFVFSYAGLPPSFFFFFFFCEGGGVM